MGDKRKREDNDKLQKIKQALLDDSKSIIIEDKYDYTYHMYGYIYAYEDNDFDNEVYHIYYNGYKKLTFCDEDDKPLFNISNVIN